MNPQIITYSLFPLLFGWFFAHESPDKPLERQFNQVFSIENVTSLDYDVEGELIKRKTPGNALLVEVTVEVTNVSVELLTAMMAGDRYKLSGVLSEDGKLLLKSKKNRLPITSELGKAIEMVTYRIYLPRGL